MLKTDAQEHPSRPAQIELRSLHLQLEISRAVNGSIDSETMLQSILDILSMRTDMKRGVIALTDRETGALEIELTRGFSSGEKVRNRSPLVATIIDTVIESGRPAILTAGSLRPLAFEPEKADLGEMPHKSNPISFFCLPLRCGSGEIIGAIGVDRMYLEAADPKEAVQILTDLAIIIARAVETRHEILERERQLREEKDLLQREILDHLQSADIIGNSHAIRNVIRLMMQAASSKAHALITGEPGTGKELLAEALHKNSSRAGKPFVRLNLAAFPENQIENELFGYRRPSLPGASRTHKGLVEMARGGTLFLDDIGRLPMSVQARLLQLLQEKDWSTATAKESGGFDVRIISATSQNLEELIRHFRFRMDLYYRLNLFPIYVPPLRERKTDIPLLANHFVARAGRLYGKSIHSISTCAMDMMLHYHWPGNIREMETYLEQAVRSATDGIIYGYHLPPTLHLPHLSPATTQSNLKDSLAALERDLIADALSSVQGNLVRAANALGISERRIRQKMAKYQIHSGSFQ